MSVNAPSPSPAPAQVVPPPVANVTALRLRSALSSADQITLLGFATTGDGGEGQFIWNPTSTENPVPGLIEQVTGVVTGRWKRVFVGAINVRWLGAVADGTTDCVTAFRNAVGVALNYSGVVFVPPGRYKLTDEVHVANHGTRIEGAGPLQSEIIFDPPSAASCFRFQLASAAVISKTGIRGVGFSSSNTATTRVLIDAVDVSEFAVEDVAIAPMYGTNTTGLFIRGRELVSVRRYQASCARPIRVGVNPNLAGDCLDHGSFRDLYLIGTDLAANYLITVDSGVITGPVTFDGGQAWVGGAGGLFWQDLGVRSPSDRWAISNVRYEQTVAAGGWAIRINKTQSSVPLLLTNFYAGNFNDYSAVFLRGVPHVMINCGFQGTDGLSVLAEPITAMDFDGSCTPAAHLNSTMRLVSPQPIVNLNQNGSTGAIEVFSVPMGNGADPRDAYFDSEARDPEQRQINVLGHSVRYLTAPPTVFQSTRGDIVWNSAPQQGDPIGWACYASGTPGGWVPLGLLLDAQALNTTGSGTSDLATHLVASNSTTLLEFAITARRTGGARGTGAVGDCASWIFRSMVQMNGSQAGTPTVMSTTTEFNASPDLITAGLAIDPPLGIAGGYVTVRGPSNATNINLRFQATCRVLVETK